MNVMIRWLQLNSLVLAAGLFPAALLAQDNSAPPPTWTAFDQGKPLADYIPDSPASRRATAWAMLRRQGVQRAHERPSVMGSATYLFLNMFSGSGGANDVATVRSDLLQVP